jgi:[acyl-carrier-protein] S-malonyltransferase
MTPARDATPGRGVGTAAWVDGEAVPAADVEAEVDRLRSGPLADRLPPAGTVDARQLRRWVTQRVVLRRLLEREAAARGLTADVPARPDPALLGAAAADVVAGSAAARAVLATFAAAPDEAEVRAHYAAHPDRYARGERWLAREGFAPTRDALVLGPPREVDPATLVPQLRTRPTGPVHSGLGWHRLQVDAVLPPGPVPYQRVRDRIAAELGERRRQQAFARWLDEAAAARIRLAPGFEHPADPRQPDATHRH